MTDYLVHSRFKDALQQAVSDARWSPEAYEKLVEVVNIAIEKEMHATASRAFQNAQSRGKKTIQAEDITLAQSVPNEEPTSALVGRCKWLRLALGQANAALLKAGKKPITAKYEGSE